MPISGFILGGFEPGLRGCVSWRFDLRDGLVLSGGGSQEALQADFLGWNIAEVCQGEVLLCAGADKKPPVKPGANNKSPHETSGSFAGMTETGAIWG